MIFEAIAANRRLTVLLLVAFTGLLAGLGYLAGEIWRLGPWPLVAALVVAFFSSWSAYFYSDAIVLRVSGAQPASHDQYPELYNAVEGLCLAAMMPRPRLYVIEDSAPNAFATGRDPQHAAIAVTTGLLAKTDREELKGVVAHELSHIRRYDIRLMAIVAVLAGTVALLADWLQRSFFYGPRRSRERGNAPLALLGFAAALLAPLAALLMQLAISRRREFLADAGSAELTRNPGALASALEKLDADSDPLEVANKATAPLYIVNPLKEHGGWLNSLFSTHPPLPERVRRLRAL